MAVTSSLVGGRGAYARLYQPCAHAAARRLRAAGAAGGFVAAFAAVRAPAVPPRLRDVLPALAARGFLRAGTAASLSASASLSSSSSAARLRPRAGCWPL